MKPVDVSRLEVERGDIGSAISKATTNALTVQMDTLIKKLGLNQSVFQSFAFWPQSETAFANLSESGLHIRSWASSINLTGSTSTSSVSLLNQDPSASHIVDPLKTMLMRSLSSITAPRQAP